MFDKVKKTKQSQLNPSLGKQSDVKEIVNDTDAWGRSIDELE